MTYNEQHLNQTFYHAYKRLHVHLRGVQHRSHDCIRGRGCKENPQDTNIKRKTAAYALRLPAQKLLRMTIEQLQDLYGLEYIDYIEYLEQ